MRLLVLLSRFPHPLDKGDKLRAFHQLRCLAERHTVAVFALSDEPVAPESHAAVAALCAGGVYVEPISRLTIGQGLARAVATGVPLQVGYFAAAGAHRRLATVVAEFRPEHIYCQLVRMAPYAAPYAGRLPMTLDYMDVFSMGMERRAVGAPHWQRPILRREAQRLRAYEARTFAWFTHHTIISDQDRQAIAHPDRARIAVVPNGIDTGYFRAPVPASPPAYELLFCGNMAYYPNVEAACWLAQELLPRVRQRYPAARLLLAGTTPAARVLALAAADTHVHVSGWLPDIRTAYADARVFVAPMRSGTGLQNKLLEAMAMSLPCVTTPLAHRPLGGTSGQELLVGDTPAALADHICALLADPPAAARLAARGRAYVQTHFGWDAATRQLEALWGVAG